jgi:hypothetical protein
MFNSAKANDSLLLAMQILSIASDTQQVLQSERSNRELQDLLNWLSPLDFHFRQDELYNHRCQHGTGRWVLKDPTSRDGAVTH